MKFIRLLFLVLPFVVQAQHPAFIGPGSVASSSQFGLPSGAPLDSDLWINYNGSYTSSVDNLGKIVDALTTSDANHYVTVPESSGSTTRKPSYNGEAIYFNELSAFDVGTSSTFKNLHNGTAFTAYLSFKYFSQAQATSLRKIISTNGTGTTNSLVGFMIANLNSATNPHTLRIAMTAGAGGSSGPFDVTCSNNSLVDGEYNEIKIVFTGSSLTVYVRNSANPTFTQKGQDSSGSGLSSANSNTFMIVGVSAFGFKGYLKHFAVWYRALTSPETTLFESWLAAQTAQQITPSNVDVHLAWGQSNCNPGSGTDNSLMSGLFPELSVPITGAYTYSAINSSFVNHVNYWETVYMNTLTSDATKHNWILRLSRELVLDGRNPYFIQAGRGSTGLLDKTGSVDWYADGGVATAGDMFPNFKTMITDGLDELVHVLRKNPVIKSCGQFQGENDTSDPLAVSPAYRSALENLIKSLINHLNGLGYSTSNMDYYLFHVVGSGSTATDVYNDMEYVMSHFKTDFPSYAIGRMKAIDNSGFSYAANHVTNTGASQAGYAAEDFLESHYIDSITYTVDKIQYIGEPFTILTDGPDQGTFSWTVSQSDANNMAGWVKTTSSVKNPTFTLDSIARYDYLINVASINSLSRHQRAGVTVLPALPSNRATGYDYLIDLDAIMGTKGSSFPSASVVNGSATVTTSSAHSIAVNDWVRLAIGAHFYQAITGTTGTTLILDRPYEGATGTVTTPRNFGHESTYNSPAVSYDCDGDVLDTSGHSSTALLDKLGNDTGVTVRIRAGERIAIQGEFLGYFQMHNWVGTVTQPVHFYNIGRVGFYGQYGALPYPIEWTGKMQHIIVNGHADPLYEYGIELYGHPTRPGQLWKIGGRWNDGLITTGCNIVYTGNDTAGAYGYDPVFSNDPNTVATGTSGSTSLVVASATGTIPAAGRLVIHTVGTTYASGTSHYYNYSNYNSGSKTFTLTSPLSQTYTAGLTVGVNICSDYNWFAKNLWWVGNRISSTYGGDDEGFYVGFNNDAIQSVGWSPYHLENVKIYYNYIASSGRDGIQTASCRPGLEIHNNTVLKSGRKNDFTHTSALSFNDGNEGFIHRNYFIDSKEMSVLQTGRFGKTNYFFSNVWDTRAWNIDGGAVESLFIGIEASDVALHDFQFFNNTIVTDLKPAATIQHNDPSNSQSLNFTFAGNAITQEGSQTYYTEVKVNNSPAGGRGGWLIDNVLGASDNYAQFQFTDYLGGDFTIANKSSTLFGGGFDAPSRFPTLPSWVFRDIDGYPLHITRETVTDWTAGAYSGYQLWVRPDVTAPTLSTFYVANAHPDRIYFTTSEEITASGTSGFTLTGTSRTITGATIVDAGSGYLSLSGNLAIGDAVTVAYNGSNTWKDVAAALNPLASFSAVSVDNQLVLVDFRVLIDVGATYTTTTDDLGRQWNNVTTFDQNTLYTPLVDATNVTSPIELYVTQNLNNTASGTMNNTGYNASSTGYPSTVWRDFHSGGNTTTAAFEFRNLPTTHKYNIRVSGSRAASDANRVDEVRVQSNGTWSSWVTVDCSNNSSLFADFTDILRDSGGKIQVEVRAKSPSTFSYIGVIDINAIVL